MARTPPSRDEPPERRRRRQAVIIAPEETLAELAMAAGAGVTEFYLAPRSSSATGLLPRRCGGIFGSAWLIETRSGMKLGKIIKTRKNLDILADAFPP